MKSTVNYESEKLQSHVSHITERDLVLQIRLRIDKKRDRLEWVNVPLEQMPGLKKELGSTLCGSMHSNAANDEAGSMVFTA